MRRIVGKNIDLFAGLLALLLVLAAPARQTFAHGGEDHGDQKVTAAPAGANMIARVVRIGDYEVTIKHPNIEPDKETAARVFVTRYTTNEPIAGAQIVLVIEGPGAPVEVAATPGTTAGIYDVKLPPLAQGEARLSARVVVSGTSMTAKYGTMQVKMPETTALAGVALWARTILIGLGVLIGLGLVVTALIVAVPYVRRSRIKQEAATTA